MALDFPNTPTSGAIYSSSPGGPAWQWDGVKWVSIGTPGATGPAGALGGRNLLHNPYFNIQQRGSPTWTQPFNQWYTADRWIVNTSNDTGTVNLITLADADRAVIGDEAAVNAFQIAFTGSTSANAFSQINQRVESIRRLSNKQVTLSFYGRATSGTPKIGLTAFQVFGSGGSPSASVQTTLSATTALSTTWQRYTVTGTIPSSSSKTIGTTGGTDYTQFSFWLSDQGNQGGTGIGVQSGTVQLWGMQLEIGAVATPLEKIDPRLDLANCQRFFYAMAPPGGMGAGWGGVMPASGNNLEATFTFPVTMRATPTATFTAVGTPSGVASIQAYNTSNAATSILMQSNVANTGYGYWNGTITFSADL